MDWWTLYADFCGAFVIYFFATIIWRWIVAQMMRQLAQDKGWEDFWPGVIGLFVPFLSFFFIFIYRDITGLK